MSSESGEKETLNKLGVHVPPVPAKCLPGPVHHHNRKAIDWGPHGLLAYGCQFLAVIVDPVSLQHVQCLDRHRSHVTQVRWQMNQRNQSLKSRGILASSDMNGRVIVWDVVTGVPRHSFKEGDKPVLDLRWIPSGNNAENYLAALHPPYSLVVWNMETGGKLWKKVYTEQLLSFGFDPFDSTRIAFLCQDSAILLVEDFTLAKVPSGNGRKFSIAASHHPCLSPSTPTFDSGEKKHRASVILKRKMLELVTGESKPRGSEDGDNGECIQILWHQSIRHFLLLVYPREILVLDLLLHLTISVIPIEVTSSSIMQVIPCRETDALYCLHESGNVSFRVHSLGRYPSDPHQKVLFYELRGQSEVIRSSRTQKPFSCAVHPINETQVTLLFSNGVLLVSELAHKNSMPSRNSPVSIHDISCSITTHSSPALVVDKTCHPYHIAQVGVVAGIASPIMVIRMCPPMTYKNWKAYRPYLAVGTHQGSVVIVNVSTGVLEREFSIHQSCVRGIEWTGLDSFLSFAYGSTLLESPSSGVSSNGLVDNELVHVQLVTGETRCLRSDVGHEEPIQMIRVSHLKLYFVIAFREKAMEIWSLESMVLLKRVNSKLKGITSLEWSPMRLVLPSASNSHKDAAKDNPVSPGPGEEHFLYTDASGNLLLGGFDQKRIHYRNLGDDPTLKNAHCMAWKSEFVAWGFADSNLLVYNIESSSFASFNLSKDITGPIRRLRFGPGKGNYRLLILHSDSVTIWDLALKKVLSTLNSPRDMVRILDVDWATSEKPVLLTADSCIRIMDITLEFSTSPLGEYIFSDPVSHPVLLPPKLYLALESLLQFQAWREKYSFQLEPCEDGLHGTQLSALQRQLNLLDEEIKTKLKNPEASIPDRCLVAAKCLGDLWGIDFWTIVNYSLARETKPLEKAERGMSTSYDIFLENELYKELQLLRLSLEETRALVTTEYLDQVIKQAIILGETEKAMQLLLHSDPLQKEFHTDMLRACLISSLKGNPDSEGIVKLAAANLIANGLLGEGVELLILVGKILDACDYLKSSGEWDQAVRVTKSNLSDVKSRDLLCKWAEFLKAQMYKDRAVLLYVSIGEWEKAISALHEMGLDSKAVLLYLACANMNVLKCPDVDLDGALKKSVLVSYGTYLEDLGLAEAGKYCLETLLQAKAS